MKTTGVAGGLGGYMHVKGPMESCKEPKFQAWIQLLNFIKNNKRFPLSGEKRLDEKKEYYTYKSLVNFGKGKPCIASYPPTVIKQARRIGVFRQELDLKALESLDTV